MKRLLVALSLCIALSGFAHAAGADHQAHQPTPSIVEEAPSSEAFMQANEKMHENMMVEYTGDADVDFVRGMIPHHLGAIDMAKVVLEYGKDPEIRKLAEGVIAAQEKEIQDMRDWLKAHGKEEAAQ